MSITVQVLFFAAARDICGTPEQFISLPVGSRTDSLLSALLVSHPALATLLPSAVLAVNQEYCSGPLELREGDEVAVIPPVSGG